MFLKAGGNIFWLDNFKRLESSLKFLQIGETFMKCL